MIVRVALLLVACTLANGLQIDVEGGGPASRPGPPRGAPGRGPPLATAGARGGPQGTIAGAREEFSKWYRMYQGFVAGAAKVSQLISFVAGIWLIFSSPFAVVFSVMTARVQEAILCGFLAVFGVLLSMLELPIGAVQRVLQQYFFFAYTRPGRAALVVLIATITAACSKVGFMTKALVGFNALLTFYILNSQDRRFAQVDADAKQSLSQASDELRSKASEALGFTKMFSGAFGLGGGSPAPAGRPAASSDAEAFGGFDSASPASAGFPDSSAQQPPWPGSSGGA